MRERHADDVGVLANLQRETLQQRVERPADKRQRAAQAVGFDRIFDIHRGRAQVQLLAAQRRLRGVHPDLGHQVVMNLAFDGVRGLDVYLTGMGFEVADFLLGEQSVLGLRASERHPNGPPEPAAVCLRK